MRKKLIVVTILLAIASCLLLIQAAEPEPIPEPEIIVERAEGVLKVGLGSETIAPADAWPDYRFYGVRPSAQAVVFQIGDLRVAWVSLDVIGVFRRRMDIIKERIFDKTGIPTSHIMVKATHNHCFKGVTGEVVEHVAEGAAAAVYEAMGNLFEAKIGTGYRVLRQCLSVNRDHRGGFLCTNLYVMRIDDMDGITRGIIFNMPINPDLFRPYRVPGILGSGWPGFARASIERQIEAERIYWTPGMARRAGRPWPAAPVEIFTMFAQGGGGSYTGLGSVIEPWEHIDGVPVPPQISLVETIARNTVDLLREIETSGFVTLEFRRKLIPRPPFQEWLTELLVERELDLFADDIVLQAFIFNDEALWSTWPAEIVDEHLAKFRDYGGFKYNIVLEHANEHFGYPRPEGQVIEGINWGAIGGRAFFEPAGGDIILNNVLKLANPEFEPFPPFDKATMGTVRGTIAYDGAQRIEVTIVNHPNHPRQPTGRTVEVGEDGTFEFINLLPGVKFLHVIEVAVDEPEDLPDLRGWPAAERFLISAYPVLVRSGRESVVHFHLDQEMVETGIESLQIEEVEVVGNQIFGRIQFEGNLYPWEHIKVLLYPFGVTRQRCRLILEDPVQQIPVRADGTFRFDGITAGEYRIILWLDVNANVRRDWFGIDLYSPVSNVLVVPCTEVE